jgi:hypothetical protein
LGERLAEKLKYGKILKEKKGNRFRENKVTG